MAPTNYRPQQANPDDTEFFWDTLSSAMGDYIYDQFGTGWEEQRAYFDEHFDIGRHLLISRWTASKWGFWRSGEARTTCSSAASLSCPVPESRNRHRHPRQHRHRCGRARSASSAAGVEVESGSLLLRTDGFCHRRSRRQPLPHDSSGPGPT